MLINLSNHPSDKWDVKQKEAAGQYGEIVDMPFPNIDPRLDEAGIDKMVEEKFHEVIATRGNQPVVVHLMGELTFTCRLANRLKQAGIRALASTTERIVSVSKNGEKVSTFSFVSFRNY